MNEIERIRNNIKREVLTEWVAALRSSTRAQARGALAEVEDGGTTVGFCCLGVLSDVAAEKGITDKMIDATYGEILYDGHAGMPPKTVEMWAGFYDREAAEGLHWAVPMDARLQADLRSRGFEDEWWYTECVSDGYIGLHTLNDEAKFTFAEIAHEIERAYLEV